MTYDEYVNQMIKFQRDVNDQLEQRNAEYRVVHIPPLDLIPYEHMGRITKLQGFLEKEKADMTDEELLALMIGDEVDIIDMALEVYKSVLLAVHGDLIRKKLLTELSTEMELEHHEKSKEAPIGSENPV